MKTTIGVLSVLCLSASLTAEKPVDPTFLRRSLSEVGAIPSDLSSSTCRYKPLFGEGAPARSLLKGVVRCGEMTVDPGGASSLVKYTHEEQVYVVLEGEGVAQFGDDKYPVRKHDFLYLSPGVQHGLANPSEGPCRVIVMGFRIPQNVTITPPPKLPLANLDDVPKQTVAGHPASTLYQLMMGEVTSKRDRLACARVLTSLYVMEFAPGGTNLPHHHDQEEEIYLLLNGHGTMVAGGGLDGIEGRHPAKAGDAYFFRLNCTVGFYSGNQVSEENARILAVRSWYPFPRRNP